MGKAIWAITVVWRKQTIFGISHYLFHGKFGDSIWDKWGKLYVCMYAYMYLCMYSFYHQVKLEET